ncbi:MAG: XdhC family protein [Chloroflexi bacterium]|nr:XdhC family protein [Chloroflexota bacterium]
MNNVWDAVIHALERGERVALITAVRSVGSTPRHSAARLAVFAEREPVGSIGGGTMELQAIADSHDALVERRPRLAEYSLTGRGEGNLGMCGGTQEIFIDILEPSRETLAQFRATQSALEHGEPIVCATLIRAENANLGLGTRQVVHASGESVGSLGDPQLDQAIAREATRVIAEHYPQRLGFDPATGTVARLMSTRRAAIEVFLDLFEPEARLVIIGAGHIGQALAQVGKFLRWRVEVVDDRADFLAPERLPGVDATHLVAYDPATENLAPLNLEITPNTAVVVATWGWDEPALRRLAHTPMLYIGLVASLRKAAIIFEALRNEGIDSAWLNTVRVPVGLDLGAESPEEIALAIMAEILAAARGKSGRPLRDVQQERLALLSAHRPTRVPAELAR